jgi:hypothetical protein
MVGSGLSQLNNLVQVPWCTKYHGVCGILQSELMECANGDGELDKLSQQLFRKDMAALLKDDLAPLWNGFRFGLDPVSEPVESLFSPIDVWELFRQLSVGKDSSVPSSKWIDSMYAEFEFAQFAKLVGTSGAGSESFSSLSADLMGGWLSAADLTRPLARSDYLTLRSGPSMQRVLFELGLLAVQELDQKRVLLGPPNMTVAMQGLRLLAKRLDVRAPTEKEATAILTLGGVQMMATNAALRLTSAYKGHPRAMREYPVQDDFAFQLAQAFPAVAGSDASYKLVSEYTAPKAGTTSGKGRVDVSLLLAYGGEEVHHMFEVKFLKSDSKPQDAAQILQALAAEACEQCNMYERNNTTVRRWGIGALWCADEKGVWHMEIRVVECVF